MNEAFLINEYEIKRGHPCDSEEWFFKILGAPEYKHIWAPKKKELNKVNHIDKEKPIKAANKPEYVTGTGQKLWKIHEIDKCTGRPCVIHNPSNHSMRDFPTHWRSDRRIMERICPCGIGHPDPDLPFEKGSYEWVHGCDLCCQGAYAGKKEEEV